MKEDELIGMREVLRMTGLPRWSLLSRMYEYDEFPLPVAKTGKKWLWSKWEVNEWKAIQKRYMETGQTIDELCENWRRFRQICLGLDHPDLLN